MDIVTIEPPHSLKQVVKRFWYANIQNSDQQNKTFRVMADGALGIIFQHADGHSSMVNDNGYRFPISFAYGQKQDGPCINSFQSDTHIFGVSLQPAAFKKLFSINTSEITNSIIESEYLFTKEFIEQLLHAPSPEQTSQLFSAQLHQKLLSSKQNKIIDHSIKLIFDETRQINPSSLSSHFQISRRQFQRKFKEHLGVCPETYIRIIKFQKSLHLLKTRQYNKLSDIAYSLNYADQSHFVREFRLFTGCTPKEFQSINKQESSQINYKPSFETVRILTS